MAQCRFIVEALHMSRPMWDWEKILAPTDIPQMECLKNQAMNLVLQTS